MSLIFLGLLSIFTAAHADAGFNKQTIQDEKFLMEDLAAGLNVDMSELKWGSPVPGKSPVYQATTDTIFACTTCNDKFSVVIFTHEYTHAIFERYMVQASPAWQRVRELTNNGNLKKQISALLDAVNSETDSAKQDKILQQIKELRKEAEILENQQRFMTSYHEFIADSLPTVIYQDKMVMHDAIASLHLSDGDDAQLSLQWRLFNHCMSESDRTVWQDQVFRIRSLVGYFNPYDLLAPLRACSGDILLNRIHDLAGLKAYLPNLLQNLLSDFNRRIASVNEDSSGVDPASMNDTLLERISEGLNEKR